jgi:hypothetical protein
MSLLDLFSTSIPKNQISERGILWLLRNLDFEQIKTEVFLFIEPGKHMTFVNSKLMPDALAEFKDAKLAILYGEGLDHAFIRVRALKSVMNVAGFKDFTSLVNAFQRQEYKTKKVNYFSVS